MKTNRSNAFVSALLIGTAAIFWAPLGQAQPAPADATSTAALIPRLVQYSGMVKEVAGQPLASVTFALYKDQDGGAPIWMETQNVNLDQSGRFSVLLGSTTTEGLTQDLFTSGAARWLGVWPQGQPEQPRVLLLSVPYALKAADAETIGGLPPSAFALAAPPSNHGGTNESPKPAETGVSPHISGTGTVDFIPRWTTTTNLGNSSMFQNATGQIGIGTTTPATLLDVKGAVTFRNNLTLVPAGTNQSLSVSGTAFNITSTGLVHFISGQTFPGAGTITGVTAGAGLAGGGTTGNVTLSLIKTCSNGQVLTWNGTTWVCGSAGSSTITGVTAGTDLTGGGSSGNVTLNLDVTKVPQLGAANNFTASQTVTGNISATGSISGGTLSGNGAAVTGVNAALLNGVASSSFAVVTGSNVFLGNQFFNGFAKQTIVGDPGCGPGFAGIGFGALSGCNNYSMVGDGTNTYINRPTGGSIFFRENNGGEMTIAPGGAVSITEAAGGCCPPALNVTSNSEGNDGMDLFGAGGASEFGTGGRGLLAEGGTETNTNSSGGGDGVDSYGGGGFQGGLGVYAQGGNGNVTAGGDGIDATAGSGPTGNGYSGFFQGGDVNVLGNLGVSGQIFAGVKDFRIDHPLDPANKYLYHASVESSEMMNMYTGNVVLDGAGAASVQLPEWFEAVNGDYRYQLTAIGAAAPNLHIAQEVANHQFSIAGGAPGMKVSWQVTGVRQDVFAKANPLVVEVEKPANERGFYLNPELYGQLAEKQIEWARFPAKMRQLKDKRTAPAKLASVKK